MKKVWESLKWFFSRWMLVLVVLIVLGIIATFIIKFTTHTEEPYKIPLFIIGGWGVFVVLFTWVREIYWKIAGKGDYAKKDEKK
ncbi:MAG: hypothetical protein WC333_01700 [Dehalococcoidia bacterium]